MSPPSWRTFLAGPLFFVGTIAPSLAALALTARAEGQPGVRTLLRRVVQVPTGIGWYVFALGYMIATKCAAALLYRLGTGGWPLFDVSVLWVALPAILISTPVQAGEEIGWRGYALAPLASRLGLARASLVLGFVWGWWHLPLFLIPAGGSAGQSFPAYVLWVMATSVAMAWLYWRTNGSLFITMLMHAAINNTTNLVPAAVLGAARPFAWNGSPVAWLTVAVSWIPALYFLVRMRGADPGER